MSTELITIAPRGSWVSVERLRRLDGLWCQRSHGCVRHFVARATRLLMWTNVDQCAPVAGASKPRAHAARPSPVRQPPSASGRRVQCAVDGRANRNAAHSVNWLGDSGFDTPLTRQSASQKFNRDEIEEGVEVLGHGAPVSATLAHRLTEFARGSSALPLAGRLKLWGVWVVYGLCLAHRLLLVDAERADVYAAPRRT